MATQSANLAAAKPRVSERDRELHARLRDAHKAGRVKLYTNFNHLNRGGSPVFSVTENVAPMLVFLLVGVGVLFVSFIAGLLVFVVGTFFYIFAMRPWIAGRIHDRTIRMMLLNAHNWQVIWRFGGVVLTLADNPRVGCTAPDSDWRPIAKRFVVERIGPGMGEGLS